MKWLKKKAIHLKMLVPHSLHIAKNRAIEVKGQHMDEATTEFMAQLRELGKTLTEYVSTHSGDWSIKGFIDVDQNIYTISADTKIISKILEIQLFPKFLEFANTAGYDLVLAEHQNWYPDISFVKKSDPKTKFAVDIKTTYRIPEYEGFCNGFTLGSHGAYFRDRTSTKNIQFPYSEPPPFFRRLFGLSYAAIAGSSSMA